jgi:hypothetical protein
MYMRWYERGLVPFTQEAKTNATNARLCLQSKRKSKDALKLLDYVQLQINVHPIMNHVLTS